MQDRLIMRQMGAQSTRHKYAPQRNAFDFTGKADFDGEDSGDNYSEAGGSEKETPAVPKDSEDPTSDAADDSKTRKLKLQKFQMEKIQ
jgi:hypothetical protein